MISKRLLHMRWALACCTVVYTCRAVFVKRSQANYAQPWQTQVQRSAVGSAFVVDTDKRHILTNAHVVSHHITIHVRRPGHPKKWKASLLCEGKSCDLALLTVGAILPRDGFGPYLCTVMETCHCQRCNTTAGATDKKHETRGFVA